MRGAGGWSPLCEHCIYGASRVLRGGSVPRCRTSEGCSVGSASVSRSVHVVVGGSVCICGGTLYCSHRRPHLGSRRLLHTGSTGLLLVVVRGGHWLRILSRLMGVCSVPGRSFPPWPRVGPARFGGVSLGLKGPRIARVGVGFGVPDPMRLHWVV